MAKKKYYKNKKITTAESAIEPQPQNIKTFNPLILGGIVAIISFLLYVNTLGHQYTVDDVTVITNNKIVQKGIDGIGEIFTTPYRKGYWDRNENMYRPVSLVMFALEWELAGENAFVGHLVNVLLYSLTGFLLFYALALLFENRKYSLQLAFLAALIFAAHPIHTEVVANIKSRDEILAFLFSVLSLFLLLKYVDKRKIYFIAVSLFSFLVALLSKENAITFLAVFPFAIYFFRNTEIRKNIFLCALFIIPLIVYFVIRYSVLNHIGAHEQIQLINNSLAAAPDFISRIATAIFIFWKYIQLLIFPHPLVSDYSYNQIAIKSFSNPLVILSVLVLIFLIYVAIKGIKSKSIFSFSVLYYFITISIVSNVFILIEATMGERFLYMPSLGFAIALAYAIVVLIEKKKENTGQFFNKKTIFVIIVLLFMYSFKTIDRNMDWKDNMTLLETDIKKADKSAREHFAYGSALYVERAINENNPQLKQNYLNKSIFHLQRAAEIWPAYADAYNILGKVYLENKMPEFAVRSFQTAASYKNFSDAGFYMDFALAYGNAGDPVNAVANLEKALSIDPNSAEAYSNLGLYYTDLKEFEKAIQALQKAIDIKPDYAKAHYNLGLAYAMSGQYQMAIEPFKDATRINPEYTDAYNNLGNTYSAMQQYNLALEQYENVLKLDPNHNKALQNISITYRILGDEEKVNQYAARAAALNN